ncbi:GNAT family N-acetyltransferase [Isoptericola nanjingensis]|uniref:GNAT family N-acetyltransferase n=1 Tax=Isoptericola TaxID=254250 RepID=UPI0037AC8428|nr:GNAT family N-acetyltransferase [Isoptericola sp. QY 916]
MPSPTVRPARAADADALWPLARDFATSFRPRRDAFDRTLAALLARDDTLLAVATDPAGDDVPRGYLLASTHLTFLANGPVCWVEEVMVAPAHRGRGLGAALMAHAERWATVRGAAYVSLASRRAGGFYETLGYDASATFYRRTLPSGGRTVAP